MLRRTPATFLAMFLLTACTTAGAPTGSNSTGPLGKADDDSTTCPGEVVDLVHQCVRERVGEVGTGAALAPTVEACAGEESVSGLLTHVCAASEGLCPTEAGALAEYIDSQLAPCRSASTPMAKVTLHLEDWNADATDSYFDGWTFDDGEPYYEHTTITTELPFRQRIAGFDAKISAEGRVSLDYNWGDADVDVSSEIVLPAEDGVLLAAPGVYELNVYGGDNASGAWGVNGSMTFEIAR